MALRGVEILALIFSAIIVFEILVVSIKPKLWAKIVKIIYKKPNSLFGIGLILAVFTLYFLLEELSFTQIMASIFFGALLIALTFTIFAKEMMSTITKALKDKKIRNKVWLMMLVWIILILWVLIEVFLL